ncbi:MAG: TOMM precursor leader peptide-binding protein [Rhodobacteraceae bacterium]|nr:TOMM precursor leader peptide-binding protein [Paracoccaceae bacterium]
MQQRILKRTAGDTGLIENPVLAPHFEFRAIDGQQVFLVSETFNTLLHGEIYTGLLPLLDGSKSYREIVVALTGSHSEASIRTAMVGLASRGYIVSADYRMQRGQAAFWSSHGASPRWAETRLAAATVSVCGDRGQLKQPLESLGVAVAETNSTLSVIVCWDFLDGRHAETNRVHLASGEPWMLVCSGGIRPLIGPIFRPAEKGPCWACLAYRLRGHQEVHNFLRNLENAAFQPKAAEPVFLEAVYRLAAVEIAKWLVLENRAPIHNQAISFDAAELKIGRHAVKNRPQCAACGDEALYRSDRDPEPICLNPSPKRVSNSGGQRSVAPQSTVAKYRHLVDPVSGVVTWLRRMTGETDTWLNVHWAGSNIALKNRMLSVLRLSLRTKSAGKGSTGQQSEASALCEALERYSGAFHGDEICGRRRFTDFAGTGESDAVHPNDVQLFSDRQLRNAAKINAEGHPYNVVPPRFDPDAEIDWTPVWSLTRGRHRYLPTSLLFYGKSSDHRGVTDFVADSNGCAAGNTLEEAILQGFFELVERDAFAVWWYNRLRFPGVDLSSFQDEFLSSAESYYQRIKRELWVLDITGDLGIPTFVALSRRADGDDEVIIYGAGAHLDPHIAVLRAVCELNQFLNWAQAAGPGGAGFKVDDPQCLSWWSGATIAQHQYLAPDSAATPRRMSDYPILDSGDVLEDLQACRALVEAKGMEFLVLDQTRPDIGMPVVRVIVPGLRHYWARFAPGRLYDVPVAMGWRDRACTESELNPAPVIG